MNTMHFALWLASWLVLAWSLIALPAILTYLAWAVVSDRDQQRPPKPRAFDDMDEEALTSLDNHRRARVLSETGHLPPRLTWHPPPHVRLAEDCQ